MANVGSVDRVLRPVAGIGVLAVHPFLAGARAALAGWRHAVLLAGLVMIGTALAGFCPAYRRRGVRTCAIECF